MVLFCKPIRKECRSCIVIPAKNEATYISSCLESLANQTDRCGNKVNPDTFEVMLLVNNTEDKTAAVAEKVAHHNRQYAFHIAEINIPRESAQVGFIRKLLMDEACNRLINNGFSKGCIATTDADTTVNRTWLVNTLQAIDAGADGVAGRVFIHYEKQLNQFAEVTKCYQWLTGYNQMLAHAEGILDPLAHDPNPRHNQNSGASLAITADYYRRLGGMPPLAFKEDVALCKALKHAGGYLRHSPSVSVRTSGRIEGRVAKGLSTDSLQWYREKQNHRFQLVERSEITLGRYHMRAVVRNLWTIFRATSSTKSNLTDVALGIDDSVAKYLKIANLDRRWLKTQLTQADNVEQIFLAIDERTPPIKLEDKEALFIATLKLGQFLKTHIRKRQLAETETTPLNISDELHQQSA